MSYEVGINPPGAEIAADKQMVEESIAGGRFLYLTCEDPDNEGWLGLRGQLAEFARIVEIIATGKRPRNIRLLMTYDERK